MNFEKLEVYTGIIDSLNEEIDKLIGYPRPMSEQDVIIDPTMTAGTYSHDIKSDEDKRKGRVVTKRTRKYPLIQNDEVKDGAGNPTWDKSEEMTPPELKTLLDPAGMPPYSTLRKLTVNDWKSIEQMNTRANIIGFFMEHPDFKDRVALKETMKKIKFRNPFTGKDIDLLSFLVYFKLKQMVKLPVLVSAKTPGYCHCLKLANKFTYNPADNWNKIKSNLYADMDSESKATADRVKKIFKNCGASFGNKIKVKSNRDKIGKDCGRFGDFLSDMESTLSSIEGMLSKYFRIKNKSKQMKGGNRSTAAKLAIYKKILFMNTGADAQPSDDAGGNCCMDHIPNGTTIKFKPTGSVGGDDSTTIKATLHGSPGLLGSTEYVLVKFDNASRESQHIEIKFRASDGTRTGKNLAVSGKITDLKE